MLTVDLSALQYHTPGMFLNASKPCGGKMSNILDGI